MVTTKISVHVAFSMQNSSNFYFIFCVVFIFDALRSGQQFFSQVQKFHMLKLSLTGNKVSCSMKEPSASGETKIKDSSISS